jgi:hypothetical protein
MLRISSVMPPGRATPMMSDGCNKLIFSTLHSINGKTLDQVIEVYRQNINLILSVLRAHRFSLPCIRTY